MPKLVRDRESIRREIKGPAQVQVQIKEENQTTDQTLTKKEGLQAPLTKQTTVRHIEQDPKTDKIPKHINKPTVTEISLEVFSGTVHWLLLFQRILQDFKINSTV